MKSKIKYFLLFSFAFFFAGCNDNTQSSIPDFPVYLELNLTTAPYNTFRNSYNHFFYFKTITGLPVTSRIGYGGIIVSTGLDGEYYAFDMACPYEAKQNILVYPNDIGQAICEGCGSVFDISFGIGNPVSGKAKETLKRYKTNLSGDILYITR